MAAASDIVGVVRDEERFFADAGERGPAMRSLDELICQTVPELAADRQILANMNFAALSYGMYHYTYASGKQGDWPAVALANQKQYISLYICAVADDGYLAEKYGKRLGKVNTGKSCIRFKKLEDLDLEEVKNILRDTEVWWRAQPKPGG